jgi:hypothetical protein
LPEGARALLAGDQVRDSVALGWAKTRPPLPFWQLQSRPEPTCPTSKAAVKMLMEWPTMTLLSK